MRSTRPCNHRLKSATHLKADMARGSYQVVGEVCPKYANGHKSQPTTIPISDTAIAAVDAQPSQRSHPTIMNFFMIFRWAVMIIITLMTGTATTPLITALQY